MKALHITPACFAVTCASLLLGSQAVAQLPTVSFLSPTDTQSLSALGVVSGTAFASTGSIQTVTFQVREANIHGNDGRWWNGTNFQGTVFRLPATVAGSNWTAAPSVTMPALNSGIRYELHATATDNAARSNTVTITVHSSVTTLNWDPGASPEGTLLLANPTTNGGNHRFKIMPQSPEVGVWRTALKVTSGEAHVYLANYSSLNTNSHAYKSDRAGSDGVTLHSSQFSVGQEWYLFVNSSPASAWTLMTGDPFVYDLGSLATNSASSTNVTIGPESMAFFQTTVPAETLAWRLWASGATNTIYVRKSLAPHPSSYDLIQARAMLVVPPYLNTDTFNGSYFITIPGHPGTPIQLDSRQQTVTGWTFNTGLPGGINITTNDYPFLTYRVQVPVEQIAWENTLTPSAGNPNFAVRRGLVPNEFRNDAFSDVPGLVGDSITLVPAESGNEGLSDGTYYITVYGSRAFATGFTNRNPVITDVPYTFHVTNDTPNRAGWRYHRVTDITNQLGSLGWELLLSNAPAGSEIALRRNAVPGRWPYRDTDNSPGSASLGFVDYSGHNGFLQRPGHQADVWYIGVYQPTNALGTFELTGRTLDGPLTALDGSTTSISGQLSGRWEFFRFDVPLEPSLLGWDVRLVDVSGGGTPELVVRREALPGSVSTTPTYTPPYWGYSYDGPSTGTNWPSGFQWAAGTYDWTGYYNNASGTVAKERTLTMGLGNPLQPGTYYVGIYNSATGTNTTSYTLVSRAIGTNGQSIVVRDLGFVGSVNGAGLLPREADYYRVVVPSNAPSWRLKLTPTTGEALLVAHRNWLPNSGASESSGRGLYDFEYVDGRYQPTRPSGGRIQQKPGHEHLAVLPNYGYNETNLPPGEYYLAVVSEGVNPAANGSQIGSGPVSYTLESRGAVATNRLGIVGAADLVFTNAQEFGECELHQFTVPPGVLSMEVRLENRVGNPWMSLKQTNALVQGYWYSPWSACSSVQYAGDVNGEPVGGGNGNWQDGALLTVAAPVPGLYTLAVATPPVTSPPYSTCQPADVSHVLRVSVPPIPNLSFTPEFNTNGFANVASGLLADSQRAFFRVEVPAAVSNAPVLGWKLDLSQTSGSPSIRVRKGALPDDANPSAATTFVTGSITVVPGYLSAGTWYVEVKGGGNTAFTIASSAITTNSMFRPLWVMPALDQTNVAAGLSLPLFGDTGVATNGSALPGDQGIDLEQGRFHYYAILVPSNNAALLRTELQAMSGNPNIYLKAGGAPTLSHYSSGSSGSVVYDRSLTDSQNSEYGNWVPLNGRQERELTNGVWVIAVHAAGNSNCRYRLKLTCGNAVPGGLVQEISLYGTPLAGQSIAGRDWRYYRFTVPANPPANYVLTFNRTLGGARVYVRDITPPGDVVEPSWRNYDSGHVPLSWGSGQDNKNQGPYPRFADPGTFTLSPPPLRPGSTYFLGVWSLTDSVFSLGVTTNGASLDVTNTIAFYGGGVTNVMLPGNVARLYRVDVPADATRWKHYTTNGSTVVTTLEQGTLPSPTGTAHWRSSGANPTLNQPLNQTSWPWQPAHSYYLLVTNNSASPQVFTLRLDGRNAVTEDEDNDGLPDYWETTYYGSIYSYNGNSDTDGDGVSNYNEWLNGNSPVAADSSTQTEPERLANGYFQFLFVGPNNGHYRAQYRTNLTVGSWVTLVNFTNVGGSTLITDTNAASQLQRFYRVGPMP